jgi:hypothetical protein
MRILVYDELLANEIEKIESYLKEKLNPSNINKLYWMPLPIFILTNKQKQLQETTGPFKIAVDLRHDSVRFELLVRGEDITNQGGGHADERQAAFIHAFADKMARELNLKTCL